MADAHQCLNLLGLSYIATTLVSALLLGWKPLY